MKRTIAVHKSFENNEIIADETWNGYDSYVAITKYVTVDFPDLDAKEYVPKQVALLKGMKDDLREKHAVKIASIDEQISKLTAITHQSEGEK